MHEFCGHHGLTISASKTGVVVFNGSSADTWYLGEHALSKSTSFKYLDLIFHECGNLSPALARLAQNGKGATALLHQKFKKLMCDRSFPMMRRLFDTIVLPTVSYGCEIWAPDCSRALDPEIKAMQNIQINFFRQLCHLIKSVSPPIIVREFAERPWLHTWWLRVLRFMHRLSEMSEGSLHLDVLKDNMADARQ